MPRPTGESKTAQSFDYWIPKEVGESSEGLLDGPFELGDYGAFFFVKPDEGPRVRLPKHAALMRKIQSAKMENPGALWLKVTLTALPSDESNVYDYGVEFWPVRGS